MMRSYLKKIDYITYPFIFSLIFWGGLVFLKIASLINATRISNIAAQSEFLIHFFTLLSVFPIYFKTSLEDRKILKWFLIANIFLFLTDLAFYISVYFSSRYILSASFTIVLLGYIPYLIWIISTITFLSNVLVNNIFGLAKLSKSIPFFITISLIPIFLFFVSINHVFNYFSWEIISHIISFMSEFYIFNAALLCLIYSENKGFSLCLLGFITLISGDFFINYSFLSQTDNLLSYGELLWFLGLIFILFGSKILQQKNYAIHRWFSRTNTIKNRLALWSFGTSMSSFLLFFLIAYLFSAIDKQLLLGLPIFVLMYSVIVVAFSIFMGKRFEAPFKKIVANIEYLMSQNDKTKIDNNFSTQEFVFLQEFIFDAFDIKEQKERATQTLLNITAQAAHDIRSPLAAINTALSSIASIPEGKRLMIRNAAKRINDIANNLLLQPNHLDNNNKTESGTEHFDELIFIALETLVAEKRYEYSKTKIPIHLHSVEQVYTAFVHMNLASFKRVLSNLINNSIEALQDNGFITIWLSSHDKTIELKIQDNGCGIPPEILPQITQHGFSYNKKQGAGFGLSYAKQYIEEIHGSLHIFSELNKGTTITITLPRTVPPQWFCDKLLINTCDIIIVLDDDPSIHDAWTERLSDLPNLKIIHYQSIVELLKAPTELQIASLYLIDYEFLMEDINGLDVINELNIHRQSVLVTSAFEDPEIRDGCSKLGVKIIPKPYVPYIEIEHSFKVEPNNSIVLIDDDEIMQMTWLFAAEEAGYNLKTYSSFESFTSEIDYFAKNTTIYIDSDLGTEIKGEEYAYRLFNQGFTNINLATGYTKDRFAFPWIKSFVGKTPPFCKTKS